MFKTGFRRLKLLNVSAILATTWSLGVYLSESVEIFLAVLSRSWSLVVGRSVGRSVGPSVRLSVMFVKKWSLEYQKVIKTHLCTYLRDNSYSSYNSDSSDNSDNSDNSDSSDSSDSNDSSHRSDQKTLYTTKLNLPKTYLPTYVTVVTVGTVVTVVAVVTVMTVVTVATKQLCTQKN